MEQGKFCAVCGHALNHFVDREGNEAWIHPMDLVETPDHPPVPIDRQVTSIIKCDFCSVENAPWVVPANSFEMPTVQGVNYDQMSNGDWAACDICVDLINRQRWTALVKRSNDMLYKKYGIALPNNVLHRMTSDLYRRLAVNITGEPYREK